MNKDKKIYYSVKEVADMMGLSRITIFNRIKNGQIKAEKIGRNYAIHISELPDIFGEELSTAQKRHIDFGVKKVVAEYGETLQLLAKE